MTSSSIDEAIAAASKAASQISQEASANMGSQNLPSQSSQGAVAETARNSAPLSSKDMLAGGTLNVRDWLKVNEFGLYVGNDKSFFDEIKDVIIDFSKVGYNYSVRYGNPPQYEKSYTGLLSTKGKPWINVLQDAQRIDPKASEFRSADIPFELTGQLVSVKQKGTVLCEAGESLGHSLSVTGWKPFGELMQKCLKMEIDVDRDTIQVDVGHTVRTGNGNTWGILSFSNIRKL